MALSSNLRKGSIAKARNNAARRRGGPKRRKIKQKTMRGTNAELRCDDRDNPKPCKMCEALKRNPKAKHMAHDPTCRRNSNYKKTNGGRISLNEIRKREAEEERIARLRTPPVLDEAPSFPSANAGPPMKAVSNKMYCQPVTEQSDSLNELDQRSYSVKYLKAMVHKKISNPTHRMKQSKAVPNVICAAIEVLLEMQAIQFPKNSNSLSKIENKKTKCFKVYQKYREMFPPGTMGFTFPKDDKTKAPDPYYSQLEGRTIYIVRWELNFPGIRLRCFKCPNGEMIHTDFDYKSHGFATLLLQISGHDGYACSMQYSCNCCGAKCKGIDGRLLAQLEAHQRNAYPVDPRYAVSKETHMHLSLSRVVDSMMVTHGNGEQLCQMLSSLRGEAHLDREEEYYSQVIATGKTVERQYPSYEESIGKYGPSPKVLRNWKDEAMSSNLTCTGVSDKDRAQREIQGVGADTSISSDGTYAVLQNYRSDEIEGAKEAHCIVTNTGEMASAVLAPDSKQVHVAHQIEQFSLRPNVVPLVHFSDICPYGIKLWQSLFNEIKSQLGWFHFIQRITKTLNKEHEQIADAIAHLSECIYWYDQTDLANVMKCIRDGLLGRTYTNGVLVNCPAEKVEVKAKQYRENIRVYSFGEDAIKQKLWDWFEGWRDCLDKTREEQLFTDDTEKIVMEQINKVQYIVDTIPREKLYRAFEPGQESRTKLVKYVGTRGAESKQEKAHHTLAHCANGGMRRSFADGLGMVGMALYNRKIRHRNNIAALDPKERAKIPTAFHGAPHFTNHLRLSRNIVLGRDAGLQFDIHKNVEILQPDNGERFFSEYLFEEKERREKGIGNEGTTNRCLCEMCGGRPEKEKKFFNPYANARGQNPRTKQVLITDHRIALGLQRPREEAGPPPAARTNLVATEAEPTQLLQLAPPKAPPFGLQRPREEAGPLAAGTNLVAIEAEPNQPLQLARKKAPPFVARLKRTLPVSSPFQPSSIPAGLYPPPSVSTFPALSYHGNWPSHYCHPPGLSRPPLRKYAPNLAGFRNAYAEAQKNQK